MNSILILHGFSCWFMTGVICLVQVLVYPFLGRVGENEFSSLHQFHTQQITWIVAPVMTLELVTAALLFLQLRNQFFLWNLLSVVSLWGLTAFVNVPTHDHLKYESEISKKNLVFRNWFRTVIWVLRSLSLIAIMWLKPIGEIA